MGLGVYDLRSSSGGGTLESSGPLVGSIRAAVYVDQLGVYSCFIR
jgi:hypothetical protein